MFFIDTNIFIEYLLDRKFSAECKKILESVEKKQIDAVCSFFSINSICIAAVAFGKQEETIKMLDFLLNLENLFIAETTIPDNQKILEITKQTSLDFDDALQYFIAKETECNAIITLDADFKKTKMKVLHPKEFKIE